MEIYEDLKVRFKGHNKIVNIASIFGEKLFSIG